MPGQIQLPRPDDLDSTWAFVQNGVEQILLRNLEEGLTSNNYMLIYTAIHNFCTSQKSAPGRPPTLSSSYAMAPRGAQLLGSDLYQNLIKYLHTHLVGIRKDAESYVDEALILYYNSMWARFTNGARYLNHIFEYLNRYWIKRERDEGNRSIFDINTSCLVRWKLDVFNPLQEQVLAAILKQIEKQRNGEVIDASSLKTIIQSYVSLGLDENDPKKQNLAIYKEYFETFFIAETQAYYRDEAETFLAHNSVVDYLKKVEARLVEEKARVDMYLYATSERILIKTCEEVLITKHADAMRDEFQILLDNDRQEDLLRLYSLLARIDGGLDILKVKFEAHVCRQGRAAIDKLAAAAAAPATATRSNSIDPKAYVDQLLDVYTTFASLVNRAFKKDADFVKALDKASRDFINHNKISQQSSMQTPELLAKYSDSLLKKTSKNSAEETDLEGKLDDIMTIFKFIDDKDVFQKFYTRLLSRRLVAGTSASEDAESSMIGKLKQVCGFDYTNKLQRMFQDMSVSADLEAQFKELSSTKNDNQDGNNFDFSILVLGTNFWPMQPQNTTFNLPKELVKTYERFNTFYQNKHSGRKLSWLWNLSRGEIKANIGRGGPASYMFQVSTYQMAILVAFNEVESRTIEELDQITAIPREAIVGGLTILVKAKVLVVEGGEAGGRGTIYKVNKEFRSKKVRVNLNMQTRTQQRIEHDSTQKTIEEDRKMLMQSAIVRIMKTRKILRHVVLVQETISQIKSRFNPNISDIKKCIDFLIEKEYLERIEGDKYSYLA